MLFEKIKNVHEKRKEKEIEINCIPIFFALTNIKQGKKKFPKRFLKICLEIFRTFQKNP